MRTKKISTITLCIITVLFIVSIANAQIVERYGNTVLCMYKSSDKYTRDNNPIKQFFEKHLASFGLKARYHDFDKGFPGVSSLKDVRAVLTWYNGAVVEKKKIGIKYTEFLNECLDNGIKIIVVNSFGVYGYMDRGKEKWDLIDAINPLFNRMGFSFRGFWTNKPANLKIVGKDSSMVEKGGKQDVNLSMHYQKLVPIRNDVISYLKVKRTDGVEGLGNGISSVIMTSRSGGFALENYAFRFKDAKFLLNPYLFLKKSLFHDDNFQNVGIIVGDLKNGEKVLKDITYATKYAKIDSKQIEIKNMKSMVGQDLAQYEAIIIATDSVEDIPVTLLKQYAAMGGSIVFIRFAQLNKDFQKLLGISSYPGSSNFYENGFVMDKNFFINDFPINGRKVGITAMKCKVAGVKLLAYTADYSKVPVVWVRSIGKGKVLYWNTDLLLSGVKGFRGNIIQSIHYISDGFVTATANIGMMMIDDYPQPWWNINYKKARLELYDKLLDDEKDDEKRREYKTYIQRLNKYPDITDTQFIKNIWFRDIKMIRKKLNIPYSTYLIFNYNKHVGKKVKKFVIKDFYLSEGGLTPKMGNMILGQGWEMGLHGFNHQSMTLTKPEEYDSAPWSGKDAMIKALTTSKNEWIKLYGSYALPFSYVAPHNVIDKSGTEALAEVFPSIRALCALYGGKGGETDQEFDWTSDGRFFMIPRASSGYSMQSNFDRYFMYDLILNFGVVSHFIHPDDVFDVHRSNQYKGWDYMKNAFINEFSNIKKFFPFIRWMTVKDAFNEFVFYTNTNIRVKRVGKEITVYSSDGSTKDLYLRLRVPKNQKIVKFNNCSKVSENKKSGDVFIKSSASIFTLVLK